MNFKETIYAVSSGVGRAAVCVIRISGSRTKDIIQAFCGNLPLPARIMQLYALHDPDDGIFLDRALVVFFESPRSFTGEDSAEFHIHGSLAVRKAVLNALSRQQNCRPAEKGEFTQRAFLNGKMDLAQVEGLADLIDSETEQQRLQAVRQMDGLLGRSVTQWREILLKALVLIEGSLDFSDEEDLADNVTDLLIPLLTSLKGDFERVLKNRTGERIRESFSVVLAGKPNAGKSSLLNALARRDIAIVSDIPGTTRDILEAHCDLDGYPVIFSDTAGLRHAENVIEHEGISRAQKRIEEADIVLWLIAPDVTTTDQEMKIAPEIPGSVIRIATKCDITTPDYPVDISISVKTGENIDRLLDLIRNRIDQSIDHGEVLLTRERHRIAVQKALDCLDNALLQIKVDGPQELIAEDLRMISRYLESLTGMIDVEDILDELFSSFCIGK